MKFKNFFLALLAALILSTNLLGAPVEISRAKLVATNWYRHYAPQAKHSGVIIKTIPYTYNNRDCFYIFSFDKGGFVLVSANDAVAPILGYGFDFSVPDSITNESVKSWFDGYARQIDTAFLLNLKPEANASKWIDISRNSFPKSLGNTVGPLLTTTWDQGCYYNEMCPSDSRGPCGHNWTGCVATAMAQIMKYWNYPPQGVGYNQYYIPFKPQYGKISAYFNETAYQWEQMPNALNAFDTAVSSLMLHCGVAVNMQYDPDGSGAYFNDVKGAFVNFFDYSPDITMYMPGPADSILIARMKADIDSLMPVYMRADNYSSGHAFVCDGYDATGFFHFNFGWSGMFNGYYSVTDMVYGYNNNQGILTGIKPNNSAAEAKFETAATDTNLLVKFINYSRGNLVSKYWDFGDGHNSIDMNPIHRYDTTGFFNVRLVVCDSLNCDTLQKEIGVFNLLYSCNGDIGGISNGTALCADFDNDDDLDILVDGYPEGEILIRNDSNSFNSTIQGVPQNTGTYTTGDFDNDGDMDLLFSSGYMGSLVGYNSQLYRNDTSHFTVVPVSLPKVGGIPKFTDFDNDGKLDIAIVGGCWLFLFKNNGKTFVQINHNLPRMPVYSGYEWADMDADGYQDLIVSGWFDNIIGTRIFKNLGNGNFVLTVNNLDPDNYSGFCGTVKVADFNKDDNPDIIVSGTDYYQGPKTIIFINNGNWIFEKSANSIFSSLSSIDVQAIDINGDKNIDVILGSKLFCNAADSGFYNHPSNIIDSKTLNFDFNKDKRPDLYGWGTFINSRFYENIGNSQVPVLTSPSLLTSNVSGNAVKLSWDRSKFGDINAHGITYNIRIGSGITGVDILAPESNLSDGFRKKVDFGNAGYDTTRTIQNLMSGKYYWSVQPIDNALNGWPFSVSDSFNITNKLPPELFSFTKSFYMNTGNNFSFNDFGDNFISRETDTLIKIKITSLPVQGFLFFNNSPVIQNQSIRADSISFINYKCNSHTNDTIYWNAFDGNTYAANPQKIIIENLLFKPVQINASPKLSKFSWGDYDHDGDLDLASTTNIFNNNAGTFTDIGIALSGSGDVNWGDIDSDGDLDLAIGEKIYKNNGNDQFLCTQSLFPVLHNGSAAFGDLFTQNNLDYLYSGDPENNSDFISRIYPVQEQGIYSDSTIELQGFKLGAVAWGDYDNNGEQDIALNGTYNISKAQKSLIYHNKNGLLTDVSAPLYPVNVGTLDWGDFDRDGDLDLLLCGYRQYGWVQITKIYRNNNGIFTDFEKEFLFPNEFQFAGVSEGFAKWVDFDGDGFLDIVYSGIRNSGRSFSSLFKNTNGTSFTEITCTGLPNLAYVSCATGDFNNDGFSDFFISGLSEDNDTITAIYRNCFGTDSVYVNTPPSTPNNLQSTVSTRSVSLHWDKSLDNTTLQNTLSYNIYIRKSSDNSLVASPLSDTTTGFRKIVSHGNTSLSNFWIIDSLMPGTYNWSVQAIDNSFVGGEFSDISSFTIILHPELFSFTKSFYMNSGNNFCFNDFGNNFISRETDTLIKIKITSLPVQGSLFFNNAPVFQNQSIRADSISFLNYICNSHTQDTIFWNAFDGNTYAANPQKIIIENLLFKPVQINASPKLSKFAWGDYDHDGDLDLASTTNIFNNNAGTFTDIGIALSGSGDVNWGDIDSDGDLDLAIGEKIYKNNGNDQFLCTQSLFPVLHNGSAAFGDLYTQNKLDYLYSGDPENNSGFISRIYPVQEQGVYSDSTIALQGFKKGAVAWGDYDNDGEQDLALSGIYNSSNAQKTIIYHNQEAQFTDISACFNRVNIGSLDWADFDKDGDLDLLLPTKVYRNNHGILTDFETEFQFPAFFQFPAISEGYVKWVDFDGDGFLDIVYSGICDSGRRLSYLYKNINGTSFVEITSTGLPNLAYVSCATGDFNNDGFSDFFISGLSEYNDTISAIYRNCFGIDSFIVNTPPSAPNNLQSTVSTRSVSLHWDKSLDNTTLQNTLSYNIYIRKSSDNSLVASPMSDTTTGFRKIASHGNTSLSNFWIIDSLTPANYYWAVQALDNSFEGGNFSTVSSFTITGLPNAPGAISGITSVCQGQSGVFYTVPTVPYATSYLWTLPYGVTGSSTTNSIYVDYLPEAISGDISVRAHNSYGDGIASAIAITVHPLPESPGAISGAYSVCQGSDSVIYSVPLPETKYNDWYLPSIDELNMMFSNLQSFGLGGFATGWYHSSSEAGDYFSWAEHSIFRNQFSASKSNELNVRAVRNFTSLGVYHLRDTGPGGGLIFYILDNYDGSFTYFEAAPCDQSSGSPWGCDGANIGATSTAIGTGSANTEAILNSCNTPEIAARICANYLTFPNTYTWTVPQGWTIIDGQGTFQIKVVVGSNSGAVTFTPENSCGNGQTSSMAITVNPITASAGNIIGDTIAFQGTENAQYSVPLIPNATFYSWEFPSGVYGTSSTNSISVTYSTESVSGVISVRGQGGCGYGDPSFLNVNVFKKAYSKVYLEGLYNLESHLMNGAKDENGNHFNLGVADKISMELHNSSFPYSLVYVADDIELKTDGTTECAIPSEFQDSYYIVIKHRNSLETWSNVPVSFQGISINYDFSDSMSKAFESNMKKLEPGIYGLYSGDINHDGIINALDLNQVQNGADNFHTGYIDADSNGDGVIDALDLIIIDNNASNYIEVKKPL